MREKEEQKKNKSWTDCPLTDYQRSIQIEDTEWTVMGDLYVGNLANDNREEEILAFLGLVSTTYLWYNNLARRQYTKN